MAKTTQDWDHYVTQLSSSVVAQQKLAWPGDEWGTQEEWQHTFESLFLPCDVAAWKQALEIGQGSGKYTKMVLDAAPECRVVAFDTSQRFIEVCRERLGAEVGAGRLSLEHLRGKRPNEMLQAVEQAGLRRRLDAFFSIDAMVHVDLQYLITYFLTGALVLRPGGHLIMTLADATTERGFKALLKGIGRFYHLPVSSVGKFEWMSRDMAASLVERLGFTVVKCAAPPRNTGRDIHLIARLDQPEVAEAYAGALRKRAEAPAGGAA